MVAGLPSPHGSLRRRPGRDVFNCATCPSPGWPANGSYSRTNKKHVACQEVGHLFGLNHNRNETNTCMNDTILTAPQPNLHDQSLINSIY